MFRKLRFRLFVVMLAVVTIFVAAMAFFASQTTVAEFQHYLEFDDTAHQQQVNQVLVGLLQTYYAQHQSWDSVQPLVEQLGEVTSTRIVVVDQYGSVVADSRHEAVGMSLPLRRLDPNAYLRVGNSLVGAVAVYGSPWILGVNLGTTTFISSVNSYLLLAVVVGGVAALLLALVVAGYISRPLEALTLAARQIEKGNFGYKVNLQSKDEIGELAGAFNSMVDRLQQSEQARRNLVSDVAHELRTPLSCILGYLEALQDGLATADSELIASLYEEAMLLRRLVIDLQELALADSGQLRLVRETMPIADLIDQAIAIFQPLAQEKRLVIQAQLPKNLPPISVDNQRIGQVLRNLLRNAITYTPEGGQIYVAATAIETEIRVTIADTGIGLAPEHLPYVFDRFYRVDRSRTQATGGSGLGLAIVKQIIEAHGGRIWVESVPGNSATFTFTLPTDA